MLITPDDLEISPYTQIADEEGVQLQHKSFHRQYFVGLKGYNRLMLSEEFHRAWQDYEYFLIAQLDTYFFRDELDHWMDKGYDFVGPPITGHWRDTRMDIATARIGNGGLSLRRTQAYLDFFEGRRPVFSLWTLLMNPKLLIRVVMERFSNSPKRFAYYFWQNEDTFWTIILRKSHYALRLPSPEEAMHFGFDRFPSTLYKVNGGLPMACHAWHKYEYESFWKPFITA